MDINNFGPFQADVWGTAADWTVAFAAIISGIFLYSTLKSQIQSASLSESQYLRSIMPVFVMSYTMERPFQLTVVEFTLYQNPAFDAAFYVNGSKFIGGLRPTPRSMPVNFTFQPRLSSKNYEDLVFEEKNKISFQFHDSDGNLYEQAILPNDFDEYSLGYPQLLKKKAQKTHH